MFDRIRWLKKSRTQQDPFIASFKVQFLHVYRKCLGSKEMTQQIIFLITLSIMYIKKVKKKNSGLFNVVYASS